MIGEGTDMRASNPIYAQPRLTDRWQVEGPTAEAHLRGVLDGGMPRDPMYPDWQRVRSTYIAPPTGHEGQSSYPRVRQYLGPLDDANASGSTFLEVKFRGADGSKHKSRMSVAADFVDRLQASDGRKVLAVGSVAEADRAVASHVADLLDQGWSIQPGTDYGRLAWEDPAGTFRITLDRVGPEGEQLSADNVVRRRLEVKALTGDRGPAWLGTAIGDAVEGGLLTTNRASRLFASAATSAAMIARVRA